ncbi:MAG: glycosyltransferase [Chloroflexi bacterium]|nr:glycosyltransferase [Chloroflexota bacterium]
MISDQKVLKGVYAGIKEDDKVILWNGGMVHWYDPETFLRALHLLAKERDDIKALFLGTFYAGLGSFLGYGQRFEAAFQLSKDLGLYQRSVFFEFGYVPHDQVKNFLLESDIGICTYLDNMETRYAHRTSFLDLMWAELPIICTEGDVLSEMVAQRELGIAVAERDVAAVAEAITRLVDDQAFYQQCQENLRAVKPSLTWEVALEPLIRFCRDVNPVSVSKSDRFVPLLSRSAEYVLSSVLDSLMQRQ